MVPQKLIMIAALTVSYAVEQMASTFLARETRRDKHQQALSIVHMQPVPGLGQHMHLHLHPETTTQLTRSVASHEQQPGNAAQAEAEEPVHQASLLCHQHVWLAWVNAHRSPP